MTMHTAECSGSMQSGGWDCFSSPASFPFPFNSENPQPLAGISLGYIGCFLGTNWYELLLTGSLILLGGRACVVNPNLGFQLVPSVS